MDDLRRTAASVIPPAGAGQLAAVAVDGGYRAAWLVGGLRREPFGPTYARPRDACRLIDLLEGGTTR